MKPVFFSLTNPSPDEERDRSRDVWRSIDEEKGPKPSRTNLSLRVTIYYTPPRQFSFPNYS